MVASLAGERYISLTTFKRDGTPVSTPVWVASDDGRRLLVWSGARTWKVRRLRRDPRVLVAAASFRGVERGARIAGQARVVDDLGICSEPLSHRIKLTVPPGVDYDLKIWDACGGALLASSNGGTGVDESITITKPDGTTADKSFNYWIEIVFHAGSTCDEWTLNVEGRNTRC